MVIIMINDKISDYCKYQNIKNSSKNKHRSYFAEKIMKNAEINDKNICNKNSYFQYYYYTITVKGNAHDPDSHQ